MFSITYIKMVVGKNEIVSSYIFTEFFDKGLHQKIHNNPYCDVLILITKCIRIVKKYIFFKIRILHVNFKIKGETLCGQWRQCKALKPKRFTLS